MEILQMASNDGYGCSVFGVVVLIIMVSVIIYLSN